MTQIEYTCQEKKEKEDLQTLRLLKQGPDDYIKNIKERIFIVANNSTENRKNN